MGEFSGDVGKDGGHLEERGRAWGRQQRAVLIIACLCLAMSAARAPAAEPPEELVFDPVLSLTGGCGAEEVDPVPDPGCPGGKHPPAGAFRHPQSTVTDVYGNVYVASYGNETADGEEGRIDIFNASGKFLTEILDPSGPKNLAVDSNGTLYVYDFQAEGAADEVVRYKPSAYNSATEEIEYKNPPELVAAALPGYSGMAVDRSTDHLFIHLGNKVREFGPAEEGNKPLGAFGEGSFNPGDPPDGRGLAVDSGRKRIYVSDQLTAPSTEYVIDVFELEAPHNLIERIDGSATQPGKFLSETAIAVDEGSGNVFAYTEGKTVYELDKTGALVDEIEHEFKKVLGGEIGVDNGASSPNAGYLFVPSNPSGVGHSFAFGPLNACPAETPAASVAAVTEEEVELSGTVEPCNLETAYRFEVTTLQKFDTNGFEGAKVIQEGQLPAVSSPIPVSASASGLAPETPYRFRLTATNELGGEEADGEFTTYPSAGPKAPCPNDPFRTGVSAMLPDCRAYELVTPGETSARAPRGVGLLGAYFATREASPAGDRLSFITEGGTLPGSEGTGSLGGDSYLSKREPTGWATEAAGPSGGEAVSPLPGGVSTDQGYSFWSSGGEGSAAIEGRDTSYVRYPDGQSKLVGRGSLGNDPRADGKLITEDAQHIIFISGSNFSPAIQLEPNAPPKGTRAVYDRTADEVTHVVSLLPESKTPKAAEDAIYEGASLDGRGVAFSIGSTLYLRYEDQKTFEIGDGVTFAGIAQGGARIFYLEGGKLFRFDALSDEVVAFNTTGAAIPVNVSADGTAAYFVSTAVLTTGANPNGAKAKPGQQNLYLSEEGTISFVGTVMEEDVDGEKTGIGLGAWTPHVVSFGEAAEDPSRSTPDGKVLVFEARAKLAGYDPEGHTEIYRYDSNADELTCLSCNPTGARASGGATLQSVAFALAAPEPISLFGFVANLRGDGRRAFFQSTEALVPLDTDGLQDVYEWEAEGVGSCSRAGGCIYLISSGQSPHINYLYAVSDSGDDVFFRSSDLLLPSDLEETPSIYDARVGGGFAEEAPPGCEGEGCRPALPAPPPMKTPESAVQTAGPKGKTCPKGKRKAHRGGKVICVKKKHHKKHPHKKAGKSRGAGK